MGTTAQQNEPPDKRNLAQILQQQHHSTPVKKNHGELPTEVKSRWFKCRIRNVKFLSWIIDQFKHVKVCAYSLSKYLKKDFVVLNVGFDVSCEEGKAEFDGAKEIKLPSGSVIKAVPDELLDEGYYFPKPMQKIYLECVPYDLFVERDQLASALKEYVDFFEADCWEWICEKGCFTGKVNVEVKSIKKKPPRDLELGFNNQTIKLFTLTRGFDAKIKEEADALAEIVCHSCKQKGHLAKNCQVRKNRIFSWKCTNCGGHSHNTSCKEGSCQMNHTNSLLKLAMGKTEALRTVENIQKVKDTDNEDVRKYAYTVDKVKRRTASLAKLQRPRSKNDDTYKRNRTVLIEIAIMKKTLGSIFGNGLERFSEIFDAKLANTKLLDHTKHKWYSGFGRVKSGEGVTIMEKG